MLLQSLTIPLIIVFIIFGFSSVLKTRYVPVDMKDERVLSNVMKFMVWELWAAVTIYNIRMKDGVH